MCFGWWELVEFLWWNSGWSREDLIGFAEFLFFFSLVVWYLILLREFYAHIDQLMELEREVRIVYEFIVIDQLFNWLLLIRSWAYRARSLIWAWNILLRILKNFLVFLLFHSSWWIKIDFFGVIYKHFSIYLWFVDRKDLRFCI